MENSKLKAGEDDQPISISYRLQLPVIISDARAYYESENKGFPLLSILNRNVVSGLPFWDTYLPFRDTFLDCPWLYSRSRQSIATRFHGQVEMS
jgi:hypothetical protein